MPNCTCCTRPFNQWKLVGGKCLKCKEKEIVEINELLRRLSEQHQHNCKTLDKKFEKAIKEAEQLLEYTKSNMPEFDERDEDNRALWFAIYDLEDFVKPYLPPSLIQKIANAKSLSEGLKGVGNGTIILEPDNLNLGK